MSSVNNKPPPGVDAPYGWSPTHGPAPAPPPRSDSLRGHTYSSTPQTLVDQTVNRASAGPLQTIPRTPPPRPLPSIPGQPRAQLGKDMTTGAETANKTNTVSGRIQITLEEGTHKQKAQERESFTAEEGTKKQKAEEGKREKLETGGYRERWKATAEEGTRKQRAEEGTREKLETGGYKERLKATAEEGTKKQKAEEETFTKKHKITRHHSAPADLSQYRGATAKPLPALPPSPKDQLMSELASAIMRRRSAPVTSGYGQGRVEESTTKPIESKRISLPSFGSRKLSQIRSVVGSIFSFKVKRNP